MMGLLNGKVEQPGGAAPQDGTYGSRRSRLQKMESRLTAHMDSEDRRVKELTEGILYDFLPSALNVMLPRCEDHLQELDADRCRAVASAALAVSALMNAPAGFLEFLLCVPWRKLSQLYPKTPNLAARPDSIDKLVSNLQVTDEERRKLVNTRIDSALMCTLLDFLYKDKHADSVPPMLQLTPVNPLQPDDKSTPLVVRETVAAVLDGATPLHCAALRGNPAQVDHLLYCGADPALKTAAGELPIELVPVCGDRCGGGAAAAAAATVHHPPHGWQCRCMGLHDQEVWECRSRLARSLIARRCFFSFGVGLFSWLRLVVFCLLCLLGQAGCYTSISRPVVERHIDTRRQQKVSAARARAHALVTRMRSEAEAGLRHLEQAKRECMESAAFQRGPPDISQMCFTSDPSKAPPLPPPPPPSIRQIHDINFHLQESGTSSTGEELASEKAFKCFVRSVHALQSLDLHGDVVPQVFAELVAAGGAAESRETHVLEDEQAELYSCWAESVLLKFRGCSCPGCAALAIQAVRMAHIQATRLFGRVDRMRQSHADRWRAVGQALARVVYVHICLLLETEAQASPTRSLVWRAEQCLREWDRLEKAGLTQSAGVLDPRHVSALQLWAKTADSDLYLAEALHGQSMPPTKTLQEVVQGAVSYGADNTPILARPVSTEVVASLEQAITLASLPSPRLSHIVRGVVANAVAELAAAARLREFVGARGAAVLGGAGGGTSEAVAALTEALRAAEPFRSRLGPELDAAQELHSRWTQRAQALEKLEGAVEEVRAYTSAHPLSFSLAGAAAAAADAVAAAASTSGPVTEACAWTRAAGTATRSGTGPGLPSATSTPDLESGSSSGARGSEEPNGHGHAAAAPSMAEGGGGGGGSGGWGGGEGGGSTSTSGGTVAAACGEGTHAPDLVEWDRRMKQLEAAMNDAKDANISVTKAKRLLKEMAAVAAAAEAARQLEAVMARRPSGPVQLKLALNKAEAAASNLSGLGGAPVPGLADVLGPLVAAARRRLDTERAAEALSKAAASYRTLADLARLEAAIYNAKKIGAEVLDPDSYRASLELRAHLQEAARMRSALETGLRNLQNQLRPEDAEALERALQDASRWEDLLASDMAKARKALEHWRAVTANDAKLARLLREGASTGVLARAIQEAAASGVKVQQAKKVLKLMQALEAVLVGGGADGGGGAAERYAVVKAKLEAAEQGGVTAGPLAEAARRMLTRLAAQVAREALEAALKPHSDWSMAQRITVLHEALEKADGVMTTAVGRAGAAAAAAEAKEQQHLQQAAGVGRGQEAVAGRCHAAATASGGGEDGTQQQQQQAARKLANGSASGKTSREKRRSGGSNTGGNSDTLAAVSGSDDSVIASEPPTPSAVATSSGSSGGCSSSTSSGSSAVTSSSSITSTSSTNSICSSGVSGATAAGADEEILAAVRELVGKARRALEEDQAEMARMERERLAAERARKEAQERERQERQRQEQERQKREKAEAAERERLLAEKRERARAEKARQLHQHHPQQHQHQPHQHRAKSTAAVATAESCVPGGPDKGGGGGSGGGAPRLASAVSRVGGKGATHQGCAPNGTANTRSPTGSVTVSAVAMPSGRAAMPRTPQVSASAPPPAGAASHQSTQTSATSVTPVAPAPAAPAPVIPSAIVATISPASPAAVVRPLRGHAHGNAQELLPLQLLSAADVIVEDGLLVAAAGPPPPAAPVTTTVVHTRGDSLESLGEVVHTLNKGVIEALDMDHDVSMSYGYSSLGGGPAAGSGAPGAAAANAGGAGSGGGSVTRTISGVTAAAESVLDCTPSQRTSSVMSSVASADDVMLQGTAGMCMVTGVSGGIISGNGGSLSTISGQPGGGSHAISDVSPLLSLVATAGSTAAMEDIVSCGAALTGSGIAATDTASAAAAAAAAPGGNINGSGVGVGSGGAPSTKPRFGFVDLGGASWGLDSPILTGSSVATASLFNPLPPSMGEFSCSMLCATKPDASNGGCGGSCGWAVGPLGTGASAAAAVGSGAGGMMYGGQAAAHGLGIGPSEDAGGILSASTNVRHALGSGGVCGGGGNGLHVRIPDASLPGILPIHASPRTTVATASAGMHGIVQVRPLGVGGMPSSGPPLVQLPPGMAAAAAASSSGGGGSGRSSLSLQLSPSQTVQQQGSSGGGLAPRSGYWTPPSFQTSADLTMDGAAAAAAGSSNSSGLPAGAVSSMQPGSCVGLHHLSLSTSPARSRLQVLDWSPQNQQQQQQPQQADTGLQLVHLGGGSSGAHAAPGGGGGCSGVQILRCGTTAVTATRICRFFLLGYCREGERCRYVHPATAQGAGCAMAPAHGAVGGGGGGSGLSLLPLGPGSPPLSLSQHPRTGQLTSCFATAGNSGGSAASGSSSSAVGSFAFGAFGAEAFTPLGPGGGGCGSMPSHTCTGGGPAPSGESSSSMVTETQLLSAKGVGPQLRHGVMMGASASSGTSGLPPGLPLLDRNQPLPIGVLAGGGGGNGGGNGGSGGGVVLGAHQQPVKLRDSATGATFAAVLTIPGAPTGGGFRTNKQLQLQQQPPGQQQQQQQQQQQALLLALPDDLTYSPPSISGLAVSSS